MKEDYPLQRDSYKDYDGYFGQDKFFSDGDYGVVGDKYGIEKEDYS